jgi:flagellar FliL protein
MTTLEWEGGEVTGRRRRVNYSSIEWATAGDDPMTTLLTRILRAGAFACLIGLVCSAWAESEESGAAAGGIKYVTLQPGFVTNYGITKTGRMMYLKADVTLKISNPESEAAVKYHNAALRNALVLLFSRQDDAIVSSSDGREQLRQQALAELRGILNAEESKDSIDDLVFSNFVVQH